jgi:hypothetical protein
MGTLNISLMGRHDVRHDCSLAGLCEAKLRVWVAQERMLAMAEMNGKDLPVLTSARSLGMV